MSAPCLAKFALELAAANKRLVDQYLPRFCIPPLRKHGFGLVLPPQASVATGHAVPE